MDDWRTRLKKQAGPPKAGHYWSVLIIFRSGTMRMGVIAATYDEALAKAADRFLVGTGFDVPEGFELRGGAPILIWYDHEITSVDIAGWHQEYGEP